MKHTANLVQSGSYLTFVGGWKFLEKAKVYYYNSSSCLDFQIQFRDECVTRKIRVAYWITSHAEGKLRHNWRWQCDAHIHEGTYRNPRCSCNRTCFLFWKSGVRISAGKLSLCFCIPSRVMLLHPMYRAGTVCVCSPTARERLNRFASNLAGLFLETRDRFICD
jgi:hypothetical protein